MNVRSTKIRRKIFLVGAAIFALTLLINLYIFFSARDRIFYRIEDLPAQEIALVLGTEPVRPEGSTNLHFLSRTDTAVGLFLAGKARTILISGNRDNRGFNEILEMQKRIVTNGVPVQALSLDFAGQRTWNSLHNAKNVYHLKKVIIITDAFHAPRALFLCRHFGIDAVACCPAKEPFGYWAVRYQVKEYGARVIAVFDTLTKS